MPAHQGREVNIPLVRRRVGAVVVAELAVEAELVDFIETSHRHALDLAIGRSAKLDDVPELSATQRAALDALPFDEAAFRRDAGMSEGSRFVGNERYSVYERIWYRPSLAITALEAMPLATAANQLIAEAKARVGVRLAPGQDADRAARHGLPL